MAIAAAAARAGGLPGFLPRRGRFSSLRARAVPRIGGPDALARHREQPPPLPQATRWAPPPSREGRGEFFSRALGASTAAGVPGGLCHWITSDAVGLWATALAWLALWGYHVRLDPFRDPSKPGRPSWVQEVMLSRSVWAKGIMADGSTARLTLGVHTLRNGLQASTFFVSTSVGLLTVVLSICIKSAEAGLPLPMSAEIFRFTADHAAVINQIKFASAVAILTAASASFSLCARLLMHCGFQLTVAAESKDEVKKSAARLMLVQAERHWWCGLRFLYFMFPAGCWLALGTGGLLVCMAALLLWLRDIDRPPLEQFSSKSFFLSGDEDLIAGAAKGGGLATT